MASLSGEDGLAVLCGCEENMVSALKMSDVAILCWNLCEMMVIPEEVREKFSSLDDSLEPELKVRYLLQHVYEAVKDNKLVLYSFLDVLGEVDKNVASELRGLCKCEVQEGNEQTQKNQSNVASDVWNDDLIEMIGGHQVNQVDVSVGEKRSRSDVGEYRLREDDLCGLTELLVDCSHRWEELGIALGLKQYQLDECQKQSSNKLRLNKVLAIWMSSVEPTMAALKNALSGSIVSMSRRGSQLEEEFYKLDSVVSKRRRLSCTPQHVYCSGDVKVDRGKAALLALQVASSNLVRYQWFKEGEVLSDSEVYSGTTSSVLFISHVALQTEGQYECRVFNERKYLMATRKMKLMVSIKNYSKYFSDFYSVKKEVPEDHWPPATTDRFINLALVGKQSNDDFTYAVQGDMDDIIEAKEKVEYEEVFREYKRGTLILVEGRPGSGKTTLMHKVTRDWALKGNILMNAEVVVLVPIRLFGTSNRHITLSDVFTKYVKVDDERKKVMTDIFTQNGEGLCIIIDGLDEYEYHNDYDTMILQLAFKQLLPLAMIIVASRPVGTASIRSEASFRIEVLGFKKDQILSYVNCYFKNDQSMAAKLMSYLNAHINVYRMCYLPVHAAMICFLYSKEGDDIPHTETKIYEAFTRHTLLRKLKSVDRQHRTVQSLHCLPELFQKYFNNISKLAFDMIIHSKQVVLQSKTNFPLTPPGSDNSSLGLVTIDSTADQWGDQDLYAFLHLSFQEYLAAFYLSNLNEGQVISEISRKLGNLLQVWKFYCGMVRFQSDSPVLNYIMSDSDANFFHKLQCAFESQQQVVCDSVLAADEIGTFSFKDHNFIPTDYLAVSYVISNASYKTSILTFKDCTLEKEGVELLIEKLSSEHRNNIKCFQYHNRNCSLSQFEVINMLLQSFSCVEVLNLEKTDMGVEGVKKLTQNVELTMLKVLRIKLKKNKSDIVELFSRLKFNSKNLQLFEFGCTIHYINYYNWMLRFLTVFSNVVCHNPVDRTVCYANGLLQSSLLLNNTNRLQLCCKLMLTNCGITDEDLKLLVEFTGSELYLGFNKITGKGAIVLTTLLDRCTNLQVFSAHCNQINDSGALAIANALNSNVKLLDLQGNCISADGMNSLVQLKHCGNFQLYVTTSGSVVHKSNLGAMCKYIHSLCEYGNKDSLCTALIAYCRNIASLSLRHLHKIDNVIVLVERLKCCTNLRTLDISYSRIGSEGIKALAEGLKCCTNLQTLDISSNSIGSEGVKALAEGLKCCTNLQTLDISYNSISSEGVKALAERLKGCTNLQTLDISFNSISSEGVKAIVERLKWKCCTNLQILNIKNNTIDSEGVKALTEGLMCCTNLQTLDISRNSIGSEGVKALAEGLKCCTNLQTLDISRTSIGSEGVKALAEGLKCCTNLQTLKIMFNSIGSEGVNALAEGLECCINLHTLNFSGNHISSEGVKAVAEGLKKWKYGTNLQTLNISDNSIGSEGVKAIAEGLKCCINLQALDISLNNIGSEGVKALAEGLKCCTNLQTLNISRNIFCSEGVKALAEGLKCCTSLEALNISRNGIRSEGVKALVEGLKCCTSLEALNISRNGICSEGVKALVEGLKCCTNLQTLDISHNYIGSEGVEALAEGLKCCTNLQTLDISHNYIGSEGEKALAEGLKCCTILQTLNMSRNYTSFRL